MSINSKSRFSRNLSSDSSYHDEQCFTDIHCHCLMGIDDGPATKCQAVALCKSLAVNGIKTVVATPHQLGVYEDSNDANKVRQAVSELNQTLRNFDTHLNILPGGDVRVDERIPQLLEQDRILTVADGGKYILLELADDVLFDIDPLLFELSGRNIRAIISHPERHRQLSKEFKLLEKWIEHSALIQITAGSIAGDFGTSARKASLELLNNGLVSIVATDAHNTRSRKPRMKEAYSYISRSINAELAGRLCIHNPGRIIEGQEVEPSYLSNTGKCLHAGT